MNKLKLPPILSWFIVSLFYAYQYILRVLPNVASADILKKFDNLTASDFGQFAGVYYFFYASVHIPIGILLDKKGPKYVLPISILMTSAGLLPLLYSSSWTIACIGRTLTGIGSSAAILGIFKIIHLNFTGAKFTRMLGLSITIGLLGAIYGGQPISFFINIYGFDLVVKYLMLIGVLIACIAFITIPTNKNHIISGKGILSNILQVFKTKKVIYIAICAGLMVGPIEGFPDAWGSRFLKAAYQNFNLQQITLLPSFIFIGMCLGSSFISYLADKTRLYYELIILSAFGMAIIFIYILFNKTNFDSMKILLFIVGVLCSYQILAIYKATTYVKENLVGLTTSILNMVIMSFGHPLHILIGKVVEYNWDGKIIDGTNIYSVKAYTYGISIIPICLIIGGIGFCIIHINSKIQNGGR